MDTASEFDYIHSKVKSWSKTPLWYYTSIEGSSYGGYKTRELAEAGFLEYKQGLLEDMEYINTDPYIGVYDEAGEEDDDDGW
jgi:hypothetical protein